MRISTCSFSTLPTSPSRSLKTLIARWTCPAKDRRNDRQKKADTAPPSGVPTDEEDKASKVTLSGLLNFTDGLWSICGSERIFVFTTNFVKKLDPALLHPGRMDMLTDMLTDLKYCRYPGFKILARNFLQITEHCRFADVEQIIDSSFMTPAEIAEILTKDRSDPDLALDLVVKALHDRKCNPAPHAKEDDASEPDEPEELQSNEKSTEQPAKCRTMRPVHFF